VINLRYLNTQLLFGTEEGMSVEQSSPQGGVLCHSDRSLNDLHLLFQLRNPTLEKF